MSDEDRAIRIIPFLGKKKDWSIWSGKFRANATAKGYLKVLEGKETIPDESEILDANNTADKVKIKIRKANENAYNALIQSMTTPTVFQKVDNAKTKELPNGDSAKAWKSLLQKFEPDSLTTATNYEKEFTDLVLDSADKDPEDFIEDLQTMRLQISKTSKNKIIIDDDKFMRHVLTSLPSEYDETVKGMKKLYGENKLSIDDMVDELAEQFSILEFRRKQRENKEDKEDLALVVMEKEKEKEVTKTEEPKLTVQGNPYAGLQYQAPQLNAGYRNYRYPTQFKGTCYVCGEQGHKGSQCPKRFQMVGTQPNVNTQGQMGMPFKPRFNGNCLYCGIYGHKAIDCRKRIAAEARMGGNRPMIPPGMNPNIGMNTNGLRNDQANYAIQPFMGMCRPVNQVQTMSEQMMQIPPQFSPTDSQNSSVEEEGIALICHEQLIEDVSETTKVSSSDLESEEWSSVEDKSSISMSDDERSENVNEQEIESSNEEEGEEWQMVPEEVSILTMEEDARTKRLVTLATARFS